MTRTITDIRPVGIAPNLTLIADVKEDGCLLGYSVTIDQLTSDELTAYAVIEAAELEQERHKALKIVLDVTTQDPRIARRASILDAFRDEPMSKAEAAELYGELAEIDQALQFNPSDTCNDYITAAWDKNLEEVQY